MPYRIGKEARIEWIDVQNKRFTEPFWAGTVSYCRANYRTAEQPKIETSLADLIEKARNLDAVPPTALIFHVSRCGSTLISQLLSLFEQNIVLAEPDIVDEILCFSYNEPSFSDEMKIEALSAILRFWGQKRSGNEQHLFWKTDCWHVYFYEILRKIYPDVPIILLYRNPLEILHSQRKKRGRQAVQGVNNPKTLELTMDEIKYLSLDEYMGLVLHKLFQKMNEIAEKDTNCLLVNYNEGIMPIMYRFAEFVNLFFSEKEKAEMQVRSSFHAKYPKQKFEEKMPDEDIPEYLQQAMRLYEILEERRNAV